MAIANIASIARAAWPDIQVDLVAFERHLVRCGAGCEATPAGATDLYLCCACLGGDRVALEHFDALLSEAAACLGSVCRGDADFEDEVKQAVREKLLVAGGERPPRLAEYRGRGPFRNWLRAVLLRQALSMRRSAAREAAYADSSLLLEAAPLVDPELDYLRARYREDLEAAVAHALSALSPMDRALVRLHAIEGVPIDKLSALCHLARTTTWRRLAAARDKVVAGVRAYLGEHLKLTHSEIDSFVRLLQTSIEIDVSELRGDSDGPPDVAPNRPPDAPLAGER